MAVRQLPDGRYAVESGSGATYVVDLEAGRCTCPDHAIRGARCKHLRRVAIEITRGRVPPPEGRPGCAVCGAPATTDAPPLCEDCRLEPGDLATDRETGKRVLVVAVVDRRADETPVPDHEHTVADHATNRDYDPGDPVVEAVYPDDLDGDGPPRRYRFPASRLERVA